MRTSALPFIGIWLATVACTSINSTSSCKCFPTDACWPSTREWDALNTTVAGRLIASVPLARPCHHPYFDNVTCSALQDGWRLPAVHMADPSSIMAPFFANESCDPFTPAAELCEYGNYARYAVNVSSPEDVIATISFAKEKNIRLIVRNTGHDYLGRSTGAGSISVWTHHLKNIDVLDWSHRNASYNGKAVKVGAGVQGFELLAALNSEGLVGVTGECPTVGIAGGYSQGGGHSVLSTEFGLGADQVLEWEVVLANGTTLTASESEHAELYWALSGGGAGNYAIVLSMTVKAYVDAQIGSASLVFYAEDTAMTTFYTAINAFHAALPSIIDSGTMVVYNFSTSFFRMNSLSAYNQTADEVEVTLKPYLTVLDALEINYTVSTRTDATYYDHYGFYFGPLPIGPVEVGIAQYASRLLPRSLFENSDSASTLADTVRFMAEQGVFWTGISLDVSRGSSRPDQNAVLPAWRNTLVHAVFTTTWSFNPADWPLMLEDQSLLTEVIMPAIEAITPGSGAYMNEGDFQQPNFEEAFFGVNYERLQTIKDMYDPDELFYVTKGVGSQRWSVAEDGRMCQTRGRS